MNSEEAMVNEHTYRAAARGPFAELQEALGDLVGQVTDFAFGLGGERGYPRYDLELRENGYLLIVELPGVSRDDVDVTVTGRTVTVSGERHPPETPEGARTIRNERPTGRFERTIELPGEVDVQAVVAEFHDGVLKVELPSRSGARGRRIEIRTD